MHSTDAVDEANALNVFQRDSPREHSSTSRAAYEMTLALQPIYMSTDSSSLPAVCSIFYKYSPEYRDNLTAEMRLQLYL